MYCLHRPERINMTYCQFVNTVEERVKEEVIDKIAVSVYKAKKNNGVIRTGLMIRDEEINISPAIYLEEYYEQFRKGDSIEKIVDDILRIYDEVRFHDSWDYESLDEYQEVRERIVFRLVNRNSNWELLREVPYVPYLDLAIIFYVMVEVNEYGTASMLIRNTHMGYWDITLKELYDCAGMNTPRLLSSKFQTIQAVIEELTHSSTTGGKDFMYVLSNQIQSFGSAAILYKDQLANIGLLLRENYYVLPSSVHEVIIIPESEAPCKKFLDDMVKEINEAHVEREEVLSDHAYYYDLETGEIK